MLYNGAYVVKERLQNANVELILTQTQTHATHSNALLGQKWVNYFIT